MINKHGFKMVGLKKVSGETKSLHGYHSPEYLELFYDRANGEIFTRYQNSIGHQWWTQFNDDNIVACGNIYSPKTMQEIADKVASCVSIEEHAERIAEIGRCKSEIRFYERQLKDEGFSEQWDVAEELLQHWKNRLNALMNEDSRNTNIHLT